MKYFLLSILFPLLLTANPSNSERIQWKKNSPVTWDDFKGEKPRVTRGMVAETQWSWDWEEVYYQGEYVLMPVCYFNTYGSWSKVTDPYILKHEQLHFDIGEIHVRKLRKHVIENPHILYNSNSLNKTFRKYFDNCVADQEKYDHETEHSIIRSAQLDWNKKIERQLKSLEKYDFHTLLEKE